MESGTKSGTRQGRELACDTEFVPVLVGARMLVKENGEEGIVRKVGERSDTQIMNGSVLDEVGRVGGVHWG